ncbi:CocE/NonD family hydrolase [Streptomyces sp. TRM49041]|uniref:CocE/NonD family hydrolase n=1 Tax=Streptomyces sp. TRM49041 TaxID=2603216 RepID=UPI0011EF0B6A|nr:CocE/NonD family hydrolase [Streptomyces sp. TRM49041]
MPVRTSFPYETDHADVRIPLPDGTGLYARVWRPLTEARVPALLEYDPGRLTDGTAPRDAQRHPWYAGHGYASVRVDPRGHGNSEGVPHTGQDADARDALAVVEWLAGRPWCTGLTGLFGLGPGATTALRAAALAPERAVAAVVAVCASDGHGSGGHVSGGHVSGGHVSGRRRPGGHGGFVAPGAEAVARLAHMARPPDPLYAGDAWRELWVRRLEALEPFGDEVPAPLDHGAVRAPVLAVGGWYEPDRDTVLRLVERLPGGLVRGILGPWPQRYPDRGEPPGPAIGFLQETLRWWDHHLRGSENGVMAEPLLRSWLGDGWGADEAWPSPHVTPVTYALQGSPVIVRSPLHTGMDAGRFTPRGGDADLPPDQRADDAHAACFDFPVPADGAPVEILGRPLVRLDLQPAAPAVRLTARLCDVAPDGASTLVTRGALRAGGAPGTYTCELGAAGYTFRPGHRVRIAVSSAYWPWVWPEPEARAGFTLDPAGSSLRLPVRAPAPGDAAVVFGPPEQAPPLGVAVPAMLDGRRPPLVLARDVARGAWRLEADPCGDEHGTVREYPDGLELTEEALETYEVDASGPLSARVRADWRVRLHRPELPWDVTVEVRSETGRVDDTLLTSMELVCREGDEVLFHHTWEKRPARS